jgi:hypothetical protein
MDIIEILNAIKKDWGLLVVVFTLGGAWIQGKAWFKKLTETLESVGVEHSEQNELLRSIQSKTELLGQRTDSIESTVNEIHDKIHEQEVKLAVLESTRRTSRRP